MRYRGEDLGKRQKRVPSGILSPGASSPNILVIDDEVEVGRILSKVLGEQGFAVQAVSSAEEGVKAIKHNSPDLVLLDVVLPTIDGIETLRWIKAFRPQVVVIMMSGHETVGTAVEAMKLGAHDYLPKPLCLERLPVIILQALQVRSLEQCAPGAPPPQGSPALQEIVGQHHSVVKIMNLIQRVAPRDLTVLIRGESGTGKELVARAIHALSWRWEKPFVSLDCATIPESLFESEVFGFEKGAFTGAMITKQGRIEMANGGTLFLDEIGNLTSMAQAKLLRALEEREITRLGGKHSIPLDVRVLAATNQNLEDLMAKSLFREDLFHRLNVFLIDVPPLRRRDGDVPLLARFFLERYNRELGKGIRAISDEAMQFLTNYPWPGNVRELSNTLRRAILLAEDEVLPEHLPEKVLRTEVDWMGEERPASTLREATRRVLWRTERELILQSLRETGGNKRRAAARMGIDYKTLFNKLKVLGIKREEIAVLKYGD